MKQIIINHLPLIKQILFYLVILFVITIIYWKKKDWISKIYKHRYGVALLIFFITVIFQISGSSIGLWSNFLGGDDGVLLGVSRPIRADEWATFTMLNFSQKYNVSGAFKPFSDTIRATKTDVFIEYGTPVLSIGIIYRLFQIGYLFLGNSMGLAFYWNARLIVLFLVSFEFMMLITQKNKKLSLIGAMLVAFSPIVAWWFSINGLVEMLISMQLAIVLLDKYMVEHDFKKRLLYLIGIAISAGTFLFAFYPSWEIPLAYLTLGLIIWDISKNYKNCKIEKRDIISIICVGILFILSVIYLLLNSLDMIKAMMNTVYPGARCETGGGLINRLFSYPTNLFFAISSKDLLPPANTCELSSFFDLFPLGIILSIYVFKQNKKDKLLDILMVLNTFFGIYLVFGFPKTIAKITLLSNSQANRTYLAFSLINVYLLMRSMALLDLNVTKIKAFISSIIMAALITIIAYQGYSYYLLKYMLIIIFVLLTLTIYCILRSKNNKEINLLIVIISLVSIVGGLIVNPIRRGTDVIYNKDISKEIQEIVNNDKNGKWLIENISYPFINYTIALGAPTINSTNVYPNMDLWKKIDSEGKYADVYNRYAHINIHFIKDGTTKFELNNPDLFTIYLNVDDISKLDAKYIFTQSELEDLNTNNTKFVKINENNNLKIYQVQYQ